MCLVSLLFWNAPRVSEALWLYIVLFALSGIPGSALAVGIVTSLLDAQAIVYLGCGLLALGLVRRHGGVRGDADYLPSRPDADPSFIMES
jgi:hypothetical protein